MTDGGNAGEILARWQGGVDERLDGLEKAAERIDQTVTVNTAKIESNLGVLAGRVGLGPTMWVLVLAPVALLAGVPRRA